MGVGGIGSTFAFHLASRGGHEVMVIARPGSDRLRQLLADSGIVSTKGEHVAVGVSDKLDEDQPYDLVIVTLLAHQVDAVLPALQRSAARNILFMFNNFEPERLQDAIGTERSAFGMPFVQASFDTDGRLKAVVGAAGQKTKLSDQRWVDLFSQAGLPAVLETDMLLWLRCHAPLCVAFESISIAGVRRGTGASWKEALNIAHGVYESFRLVRGHGYRLYPSGKAWLDRSPAWVPASMLWSLSRIRSFRELLATGAGECRALIDIMAEAAPRSDKAISVAKILAMKPADG
ncbi:ketopantoate reductase family protein [Agrobacterium rubi]|nr:ketopantoate reductase family protein [Agrobacterium rubi]NTF22211.1 ketopantoate reductase family protein [Agrobacterium rubi]NTF29068.1 ketopantoate reductase family protein [Agrobacterium rubi]